MTLTQMMLEKPQGELKGKFFKIVGNEVGHAFSIGEKVKFEGRDGRYVTVRNEAGTVRNNVSKNDLEFWVSNKEDIALLQIEADKKAEALRDLVSFMEETNAKSIDDRAFKVWKILKIIENEDKEAVKTQLYEFLAS